MRPSWVWAFTLGLALGCEGRPKHAPPAANHESDIQGPGTVGVIDLSGGVPESTHSGGWLPLPAARTHVGLTRALARSADDKQDSALLVHLGSAHPSMAQAEEISRLLAANRKKKPVVCHAHTLGNASLALVEKGCDRIWLSPAGTVESVGLAAELVYLKGLLDDLGIQADFLSVGKYKSAAEALTRDGPSEEAKTELLETLGSIRHSWLEDLSAVRPELASLAEAGPFTAQQARDKGLIHGIGDEADAKAEARRLGHAGSERTIYGPNAQGAPGAELSEILRLLSGSDTDDARPRVAVVPAIGSITMGSDGIGLSEGIVHESLARTLERLRKDDAVRAVVLRIDSPGGSALASDLLWLRLRALARDKPVIASVGSMAASGGYYLASAAERILSERTSIVGSIGVVGGKLVLGSALALHGVHTVILSPNPDSGAAQRAAYLSILTAWDDETREKVRGQMQAVYSLFVDRVAEGRHLDRDQVLAMAEGRIYSGRTGLELGLVDELGGLGRAIALAVQRAGLKPNAPVTVEGPADGLLAALGLDARASAAQLALALERHQRRIWSPLRQVPPDLASMVTGVMPLLGEERILAVMPFAMVLR